MSRLLLAAFAPEFADLDRDPPEGWTLACTGIGAVAAGVAASQFLRERQPEAVLFLGTCGAYDQRLAIGDMLAVRDVLAVSLDELEGHAYRPRLERIRWEADWLLPFPTETVAIPPAITQTEEGARRLAALAAAEHLELSGVFEACRAAKVPVAAALVVANHVGPEAHKQWAAHHEGVSRALVAALQERGILPSGSSGKLQTSS